MRYTIADARRTARRYAADLAIRALATARRARLLPYSQRVHAGDVAAERFIARVPLAQGSVEVSTFRFSDAAVLAEEGIIIKQGLVLESAKKAWAFDRQGVLPLRALRASQAQVHRVATVTVPALRRSWGHWILDSMPRLYLLREVFGLRDLDILVGERVRGNFLAAITAYLPADYRLVHAEPGTVTHVSEVILPPYMPVAATGTVPPEALAWLARIAPPRSAIRRLYIARPPEVDRQMTNETAVRGVLEARGFETVYPERLAFAEQVALFANASVVVGTHGSGLTGMIYMAAGGAIVELFPSTDPELSPRYNERLADSVGLRYASLHGEARHKRDSFSVDTDRLALALDRAV